MNTTHVQALGDLLAEKGLLTRTTSLPNSALEPVWVCGADCDSRTVRPGHIFVCKGAAFRPAYLLSALEAEAVAYLCDEEHAAELEAVAPGIPALIGFVLGVAAIVAYDRLVAKRWGVRYVVTAFAED